MTEPKFSTEIDIETPTMLESIDYMDADDELQAILAKIKANTPHNSDINGDRIKFLYTNKAKKEGGKYVIGELIARSEKERAVYDAYDYVVIVYYPIWKELDGNHKFIQLDKLLCGVDVEIKKTGEEAIKKAAPDSREYMDNMYYWGADNVLKSSEIVHLAATRYIESQKEAKKNAGKK